MLELVEQDICNADNHDFYDRLSVRKLICLANKCGLGACCDVKQVESLVKNADTILEVGCGYGRVVDEVRRINPTAKITAIEQHQSYIEYTKIHHDIEIIDGNALTCRLPGKFNLILLMWAEICEFNFVEQAQLIRNLSRALAPKGCIAIDMFNQADRPINVKDISANSFTVETDEAVGHYWIPTDDSLASCACMANLKVEEILHYKASNVRRKIYILVEGILDKCRAIVSGSDSFSKICMEGLA